MSVISVSKPARSSAEPSRETAKAFTRPQWTLFSTGVNTGEALATKVDSTANKSEANAAELPGQTLL